MKEIGATCREALFLRVTRILIYNVNPDKIRLTSIARKTMENWRDPPVSTVFSS